MGFSEAFTEDYLNIVNNFQILATTFQMLKEGSQATTDNYEPLTGWKEDKNVSGFVFDSATGEVTLPQTGDEYTIDAWVMGDGTSTIFIKLQKFDGSTWNDVPGAMGDGQISAQITTAIFKGSVGEKLRLVVRTDGASMNITDDNARFTLGRKG